MAKQSRKKKYSQMTTAELAKATKGFDVEFVADNARPLSRRGREQHRLAAEKGRHLGGRPKVGKGAQQVMITMERGLLGQVDAYVKRRKMSRSELIATGVRLAMAPKRKRVA